MSAATSTIRFPRSTFRFLAGLAAITILVAGCGADSSEGLADAVGSVDDDTGVTATPSDDSPGIVDFDQFPVVGDDGYRGPDWMDPLMLVLLPAGLTVTLDYQEPETGRFDLTGYVTDGDIDELFGDAKFMVRAGGFFPIDNADSATTRSFNAEIGPTGERILFAVIDSGNSEVRWSLEFRNSKLEPALDDLLDAAGVEVGARAVVRIGDTEWELSGGCENGDFIGFADGVSMSVGFSATGEPVGSFSDPDGGAALLIPTMTPVTDFDKGSNGFSMYGEFEGEGIAWSIEVQCGG